MTVVMLLITGVVYDSHESSLLEHELADLAIANKQTAHSLAWLDSTQQASDTYLDALSSLGNEQRLLLLMDNGELHSASTGSVWLTGKTRKQLFNVIRVNNEGSFIADKTRFVWASTTIPSTTLRLITLHQEHDRTLSNFLSDFGVAMVVIVVVLSWVLLWVTLTLTSLFRRLSEQNVQLEEQSAALAKSRDEALKASDSKSTFLANMSHEIRTPLTAVIGYSETLLASDQTKEERLEAINTIHKSSQHVLHIINQILDLSKIEANKLEIEKVMVSPVQILKDMSALMRMQAREKGLSFEIFYKTTIPETIFTDPTRLKQILLNLFSNAVKFTSQGHVHIEVSCQPDKQCIRFDVIDSGIGMSHEQSEKVFEAFTQADVSTTRQYGGTGLGLTLSKQFAEMMGGGIHVGSEAGKGSCFSVDVNTGKLDNVPFVEDNNQLIIEEQAISQRPRKTYQGRVLLVEDTEVNQQLLGMYVRKLGATVMFANNGEEAVKLAMQEPYDLILMDIQMPVMNGLDATRHLRSSGYTGPIVALTANVSSQDRLACNEAGCDGFLAKPVDRTEFNQLVSSYLHETASKAETAPVKSALLEQEPELADLVHDYIERLPETLNRLRHAIDTQQWDELKGLVHKLKGSGGNYGFNGLSQLAAKMEFQVISQHQAEVEVLMDELERYGQRIKSGKQASADNVTQLHDHLPSS
jgi:signal transduction histidine kinase/DNA-binding NarL/FixJ family response regulator